MVFPLPSAAAQFITRISIFLETRISISIRRGVGVNLLLMANSKGYGARNQLVATQYSTVRYYGIDHVTRSSDDRPAIRHVVLAQ